MRAATLSRPQYAKPVRAVAVLLATLISLVCLQTVALAQDVSDYIFGAYTPYSTYTMGAALTDSYYYSDSWFFADPEEKNDALALASMQLVSSDLLEDGVSNTNAQDVLKSMGFEQTALRVFDNGSNVLSAYVCGTKTITDGTNTYKLVAIITRPYAPESELLGRSWEQNFAINGKGEGEASGVQYTYGQIVDTMLDSVVELGGSEQVKYWICGESQGGAITNILAARLADRLNGAHAGIYAYAFEAPKMIDASLASDNYNFIHNYLTSDDIVIYAPFWGMTRYGVEHILSGGVSDALIAELEKLESDAASIDSADFEEIMHELLAKAEERLPTRESYSAIHTDTITNADDESFTVTYSYQDAAVDLIPLVFSGAFEGFELEAIVDEMDSLSPAVKTLADAIVKEKAGLDDEAASSYWDATLKIHAVLDNILPAGPVDINDVSLYALLKLAAPLVINTDFEPSGYDFLDMVLYLEPLITLMPNIDNMILSHHYETVIARLKLLAPQPELEALDIAIAVPAANDANGQAPAEVASFIDSLGYSWLSAEATWDTTAEKLEDNSVVYLTVTLNAVGHLTTENTQFTINGVAPVTDYTLSYSDGVGSVSATWEFTISAPETVSVSFDAGAYAENPGSLEVRKGIPLTAVEQPEFVESVTIDGTTWRFDGWYSEDGTPWAKLTARENITVYAKWVQVVDHISITFPIPELGEAFVAPTTPEGASYYVSAWSVVDGDGNAVEATEWGSGYRALIAVGITDPEHVEFALGEMYNENSGSYYTGLMGEAEVNGTSVATAFDASKQIMWLELRFAYYRFAEEAAQTWTKGSCESLTFTLECSSTNEAGGTFNRFEGITLDGKAVDSTLFSFDTDSGALVLDSKLLKTLSVGEHTLTLTFADGSAETSFTVENSAPSPSGGNGSSGCGTSYGIMGIWRRAWWGLTQWRRTWCIRTLWRYI